jgi:hypothetical protein
MEKPSYYIETSAGRRKLTKVLEAVAITGSVIVTIVLSVAIYLRDYA